jgi:hypothetical protein
MLGLGRRDGLEENRKKMNARVWEMEGERLEGASATEMDEREAR